MRKRPLSASSIKTYLQCMLKYYFRYEDKKPRAGKTDALAFGIAVHEALEYMQGVVSETGQSPGPDVYNDVLRVFMRSATHHGLSSMATYQEGREMLTSRLDGVDPDMKVLGLELKFELETPAGTPFLGSIDKLVELDEETVVIIDYKTSRFALPQDEADEDIQLSMYDLAVSMMFPQYKTILCAFDYLRLSDVVTHRTPEQRAMFVEFLDTVFAEINTTTKEEVTANLNDFCPWCDFKPFCSEYQKIVTDPDHNLPLLGNLTDGEFVNSWERVSAAKRIIDARQREFKADAFERLRDSNEETIKGEKKEIYKTQNSRMNYDSKTVFKVMGSDKFLQRASIGKQTVDRFLQDNPEHIEKVEETSTFSFMSPYFRTRKIKPEKN